MTAASDTAQRSNRLRRWTRELLIVAILFTAVSAWMRRGLIATGAQAPSFALESIDGRHIQLADLRGDSVMLHFWATWCGVCKAELSSVASVHEATGRVVSIVADDPDDPETPARVRAFVREHDIRYPVLMASPETLDAYAVSRFPTSYFVGADGSIRGRDVGMSTRWTMRARLAWAGW